MANLGEVYEAQPGLLPAGHYVAVISSSKLQESHAGNKYLLLFIDIVADDKGKKFSIPVTILENFNIFHPDIKNKNRAKRDLGKIIDACGKKGVTNSEELHSIPMKVQVSVEEDEKWGDKNKILDYLPLKGKMETKAQEPQAQKAQAPPQEENFPEADDFDVPDIF